MNKARNLNKLLIISILGLIIFLGLLSFIFINKLINNQDFGLLNGNENISYASVSSSVIIPKCNKLLITNLSNNVICDSINSHNCNVSKGDVLSVTIIGENGDNFGFKTDHYIDFEYPFIDTLCCRTRYQIDNTFVVKVPKTVDTVGFGINGYIRKGDFTNRENQEHKDSCSILFRFPIDQSTTTRPLCSGLNILNLTKNKECTSLNPNVCEVSNGDRLRVSINAIGANKYQLDKSFESFVIGDNLQDSNVFEFNVPDNVNDFNIIGRVFFNDTSTLSNSNLYCATNFKLSQGVLTNSPTPTLSYNSKCNRISVKNVTKNKECDYTNPNACEVSKGDSLEVTIYPTNDNANNTYGIYTLNHYEHGEYPSRFNYNSVIYQTTTPLLFLQRIP